MSRWSHCLLLLVLLTFAPRAWAQGESTTASSALVIVVADRERGPALTQLFEAVLQARLTDVRVRFVPEETWRTMSPRPSAALLFHLDTSENAMWTLRLVQKDRAWQRRLHGVARDPAAIEAAALIAARASVALLTRESDESPERPEELTEWTPKEVSPGGVSSAPETPEAPAAAPAPPQPRTRTTTLGDDLGARDDASKEPAPLGFRILAAYRGTPYARDVPWAHGAHVAALVNFRAGPCALVGYTYTPPVEIRTEFGDFELTRHPVEFQAGWCFQRGRLGVSPKLGVLAEPTRRRAAEARSGVGVSSSSTNVGWAALTGLAANFAASDEILLYLAASAAYFTSDLEYLAQGSESPLFSPYQVRLRVDVGAVVVAF